MATISVPSAAAGVSQITAVKSQPVRLASVDLLRGLVMVVMALDHTRDFFTYLKFPPEDLSHTYGGLFFTRVITHFCAPVFSLLAGTGAYLAVTRGKTVQEISRYFWTRGLWLVFLEFSVVGFGWTFDHTWSFAAVIWALGCSMIAMALIVRLPIRWIAAVGLAMVVGHNLLDRYSPESFGKFSGLWMVLHSPGDLQITPSLSVYIFYPLVPWIGVMACGYALGALLQRPDRSRLLLQVGGVLLLAFFILRGFNLYGNGTAGYFFSRGPWSAQASPSLTAISFFNTQKYPPSLDYLLMTLGPALIVLGLFDRMKSQGALARILIVYGRVPMFYYILHLYLIHVMAIFAALAFHQPVTWLWHGGIGLPVQDGYGHSLPFIYLMWITAVAVLYLPCRWYMNFKREHRDWNWLSYI
jgi:uncharacterized membrane protein